MYSNKLIARSAGIGYLIIFITGIFANFFVIENMVVPDSAVITVNNIINSLSLYRIGLLCFIIMVIFDVYLSWALYVILKPVNSILSLFSGWLRLVNSTIFAFALYHLLMILQLLSKTDYLNVFTQDQLNAQVMLSFNAFNNIWLIGLVFFGLHLLILGHLIYRSGFIPKFIAILLAIAAIGYLADSFASFMLPNYADYKNIFMIIVVVPGVIGELSLTLWLLIKSSKVPENLQRD